MRDKAPWQERRTHYSASERTLLLTQVGAARSEYRKGNLALHPTQRRGLRLPQSAFLRGLLIGIACTLVWGGLLSGLSYLVSPGEMNNWVYAGFKTLYAGLSGALASALTVLSVVRDENRR